MNVIYAYPSNLDRSFVRSLQVAYTVNSLAEAGLNVYLLKGQNYSKISDVEKFTQFGIKLHKNLHLLTINMLRPQKGKTIRVSWNFVAYLSILWNIVKLQQKTDVDIIYTRDFKLAKLFVTARRLFKKSLLVFEVHDIQSFSMPLERERKLGKRKKDEKLVFKNMDALVVISPPLSNFLKKLYNNAPEILIAPSGVNLEVFKPVRLQPQLKSITYTGELHLWKGVDLVIHSMKYLDENITLRIVGGKEGNKNFVRLSHLINSLNLSHRVDMVPFMRQQDLRDIYKKSRALLLPLPADHPISYYFTSPVKLFEYMASGVPIIASNVPSVNWILHHKKNALLVDPRDTKAMAGAIDEIMNNYKLSVELAREAYESVKEFTWKSRGENIAKWLRGLKNR